MYVISKELISYWNKSNTSLYVKRTFLRSLELDPGDYKFTSNCAFTWENKGCPCTPMDWETLGNRVQNRINCIFYTNFEKWQLNRLKETKPIKEDNNVNRLQKQKTQIDRGDLPEGNRIKGRACKASVGVGHLSYCSIKT